MKRAMPRPTKKQLAELLDEPTHEGVTLRQRLEQTEAILNATDSRGRLCVTRSQISTLLIGLRSYAGRHPLSDAMIARLKATNGLAASHLVQRRY